MVLVILLPAVMACTDDQVIGTSSGLLGLSLQSVGGAGRYDVSVLQITGLVYQPTDPEVRDALGDPLGLVTFPIDIDLDNPSVIAVDVGVSSGLSQPITAGTYQVIEVEVVQFSLQDQPPPMYGPECVEMVDILALPNGSVTQASRTTVRFTPPLRFTVSAEQSTQLLLQIDAPGIIGLFEGQYSCVENAFCGSFLPPCLRSYDPPSSFQLEPFFTITQL